jgi:hypothetical protein
MSNLLLVQNIPRNGMLYHTGFSDMLLNIGKAIPVLN